MILSMRPAKPSYNGCSDRARFYSPEFAVLEIACAVAHRHRDAETGRKAAVMRRNSQLQLIATRQLLPVAEELGCAVFLRGADALYAATARMTQTPLLTWDRELLERADATTPEQWLEQRAKGSRA